MPSSVCVPPARTRNIRRVSRNSTVIARAPAPRPLPSAPRFLLLSVGRSVRHRADWRCVRGLVRPRAPDPICGSTCCVGRQAGQPVTYASDSVYRCRWRRRQVRVHVDGVADRARIDARRSSCDARGRCGQRGQWKRGTARRRGPRARARGLARAGHGPGGGALGAGAGLGGGVTGPFGRMGLWNLIVSRGWCMRGPSAGRGRRWRRRCLRPAPTCRRGSRIRSAGTGGWPTPGGRRSRRRWRRSRGRARRR